MGLEHFSSAVGVVKILSLIFAATIVGLSSYSHFHSHWSFHSSFRMEAKSRSIQSLQNGYEECLHHYVSPRLNPLIREPLLSPQRHIDEDTIGGGGGGMVCPKPIMELFLVVVSVSVMASSVMVIAVFLVLKPSQLSRKLRLLDATIHGLSAMFLLIGGILFVYSAYHISNWCTAKVKFSRNHALSFENFGVLEDVSKNNGALSLRFAQVKADGGQGPGGTLVSGQQDQQDPKPVRVIVDDDADDSVEIQYHDACNLEYLIEEKYWTGGLTLVASFLYATLSLILMNSLKSRTHSMIGTSRVGRASLDKSVGSGNERGTLEDV